MADFRFLQAIPTGPQNFYGYQGDGGERDQQAIQAYQAQLAQIKQQAGPENWNAAVNAGYISDAGQALNIPRFGPAGDIPRGTSWQSPTNWNGAVAVDPFSYQPVKPNPVLNSYNDPVYGQLNQVLSPQKQKDPWFDLARAGVIGLVTGGIGSFAAPAIGGALGLGSGANPFIASLLQGLPGIAQGGSPSALIGKLLGSASGIPFGSTIGGAAGSFAGLTPQQRQQLLAMIGGH